MEFFISHDENILDQVIWPLKLLRKPITQIKESNHLESLTYISTIDLPKKVAITRVTWTLNPLRKTITQIKYFKSNRFTNYRNQRFHVNQIHPLSFWKSMGNINIFVSTYHGIRKTFFIPLLMSSLNIVLKSVSILSMQPFGFTHDKSQVPKNKWKLMLKAQFQPPR